MSVFEFTATSLAGERVALDKWRGRVLLIVNTASQCGFTPQYAGLEMLYRKLEPHGFTVLGFPCNQFGAQEPGTEAEIAAFCRDNFGPSFPIFAKVTVNGPKAHPALPLSHQGQAGDIGHAGDQVEFHQIPRRPRRQAGGAIRAADQAGRAGKADTEVALARYVIPGRAPHRGVRGREPRWKGWTRSIHLGPLPLHIVAGAAMFPPGMTKSDLSRRSADVGRIQRISCRTHRTEWDPARLRYSAPCAIGRHARPRCAPRHRHRCPTPRPATVRG